MLMYAQKIEVSLGANSPKPKTQPGQLRYLKIEFQLWGTMWAILKPKGNMSSLAVGKGGLLTLLVFLSIFLSPPKLSILHAHQ